MFYDLLLTENIFSIEIFNFLWRQSLTRIRIRVDSHWFSSLDPDPHWGESWSQICIETNAVHKTDNIYKNMYIFKMQCSYILVKSGKIAGTFNLAHHLKNVSAKVKQNIQTMSLWMRHDTANYSPHPFDVFIFNSICASVLQTSMVIILLYVTFLLLQTTLLHLTYPKY